MIQPSAWVLCGVALATAACGGGARSAEGQRPPAPPAAAAPRAPASGAPQAASRACTTPDDSIGTSIHGTFRSRAEPLYAAGAAALRELGYAVLENLPPRELITAPSYAWPAGTAGEPWHGTEHPGVEIVLFTRTAGDSTTVTIGARALCRVAGSSPGQRDGEVGSNLESIVTLTAMNALINLLRGASRS